jgi:NADH:ubiquinone oxidoreductase subunit D/NADH:ubiquinone oxidoreductase subunit C
MVGGSGIDPGLGVAAGGEDLAHRLAARLGVEVKVSGSDLVVEVPRERWVEVARALRDDPAVEARFFSFLTAVDGKESMTLVTYLRSLSGKLSLAMRTSLPREAPEVPSLCGVWPGANWHEREAWDMFGIRFQGHPDHRRILLWEGYPGHPLRKDFADPRPARERVGPGDRPVLLAPWSSTAAAGGLAPSWSAGTSDGAGGSGNGSRPAGQEQTVPGLGGEEPEVLEVNMGPQHPSTHGVLRVAARFDGEVVRSVDPVIGYLHRSFEKVCEGWNYAQIVPFCDRNDYLGAITNEWAYCRAAEALLGIEVPERAEYLRVITAELQRICSHLIWFGTFSLDLGATTPFIYAFREREMLYDLFESLCGARLLYGYLRLGGVRNDVPPGWFEEVERYLRVQEEKLKEYYDLLIGNAIFLSRTRGIGAISAEDAIAYGVSGPMLRACGVNWDLRRDEPYSVYPRLSFGIPVGEAGDLYDRCIVRMREIEESIRIVRQAIASIPEGDVAGKVPRALRPPVGAEAYGRVEGPRGEVGCYLVSDGSPKPWRLKWRAPCFSNLQPLDLMARGYKVADLVAIVGSTDIVLGEVDR